MIKLKFNLVFSRFFCVFNLFFRVSLDFFYLVLGWKFRKEYLEIRIVIVGVGLYGYFIIYLCVGFFYRIKKFLSFFIDFN